MNQHLVCADTEAGDWCLYHRYTVSLFLLEQGRRRDNFHDCGVGSVGHIVKGKTRVVWRSVLRAADEVHLNRVRGSHSLADLFR
jgi:hypothetical protein